MHFLIKRLCFCLLFLPEFGKRSRFFRGFFVRFLSLRFGHAGTTESRFFGNFIFFRKFFFGFRSFVDCLFCVFFVALFNIFGFGCLKVRAFLPAFLFEFGKVYGAGFGGERLLFRLFFFI